MTFESKSTLLENIKKVVKFLEMRELKDTTNFNSSCWDV